MVTPMVGMREKMINMIFMSIVLMNKMKVTMIVLGM